MINFPQVSFIVLTLNNHKTIRSCIESIISQKYSSFEVLVIDGGSNDGTQEIVNEYKNLNVHLHEFAGCGIGKSRQIGIDISTGEICAFVDSDCELPDCSWTVKMVEPFLKSTRVGGTWALGAYKKEYPSIARYSILQHPYRRNGIPELVDANNYVEIGTGHTLLKRSAILEVGGFPDFKSKEDVDLTCRIAKAGYTFVYVKNCEVYHLHATTFRGFVKKYERDIKAGLKEKRDSGGENSCNSGGSSGAIPFFMSNMLIYPTVLALYSIIKDRDLAWLWHPVVCSAKLIIVARSFLKIKLMKSGKKA
ncbi:glycosyltransferase [Methanosarcina sp. DH2]|uniref:glycosyltransferase n=1 Tax=Methanosarcina sp. DH2 TaxID=2605639 RepID=UPI001E36E43D|nr:glycosyltransferase [Methanosarcina sp. DH2]MCC4770982.1 glycosyltransferase [Methanosarcina sp. DH2]